MRLTDEQVAQFQTLYQRHFGISLSTIEALEKGTKLMHMMEIILRRNARPAETGNIPFTT